jgi:hypothetical protein
MKALLFFVFACLFFTRPAYSQYYYNDLVITKENMKKQASYRLNKVRSVRYSSFDGDNQPIDGFSCNQKVSGNFFEITTTTTAPVGGTSENTSFFNANGQLVKSVDTAEGNSTTIIYQYDAESRIRSIVSRAVSPGNYINKEEHIWSYNPAGKPVKMLKVKNDSDTTYISFVPDEQGNPGEERSTHAGQEQPTIFYYYDNKNQLTDIVRYNNRAKRLLPDYIFEYTDSDNLKSMLVTMEGGADYQKWNYSYNDKGLKTKDECYSKSKVLIGKILYDYQY